MPIHSLADDRSRAGRLGALKVKPPRRFLRVLLALLLGLVVLVALRIGLPLALAAWHYAHTPDFATVVRERPFRGPLPADVRPVEHELARGDAWSVGDVDPFTLAETDPIHERQVFVQRIVIERAGETLLHLEQEVAEATVRGGGDREGLALRTLQFRTHPDMRAEVRTWVSDPSELVGPGSRARGRMRFEALLFSGAGVNELVVAHGPFSGSIDPERQPLRLPWWRVWLLGWIHPPGSAPEDGLFYHALQTIWLTWSRDGNQRQSISIGDLLHQAHSEQYSYSIEFTTDSHGWTQTNKFATTYTYQDQVW